MNTQMLDAPPRAARPSVSDDACLQRRIKAEFGEMPGLKLTLPQAARLFDLEYRQCELVLERLVRAGDLANDGTCYHRWSTGRSAI